MEVRNHSNTFWILNGLHLTLDGELLFSHKLHDECIHFCFNTIGLSTKISLIYSRAPSIDSISLLFPLWLLMVLRNLCDLVQSISQSLELVLNFFRLQCNAKPLCNLNRTLSQAGITTDSRVTINWKVICGSSPPVDERSWAQGHPKSAQQGRSVQKSVRFWPFRESGEFDEGTQADINSRFSDAVTFISLGEVGTMQYSCIGEALVLKRRKKFLLGHSHGSLDTRNWTFLADIPAQSPCEARKGAIAKESIIEPQTPKARLSLQKISFLFCLQSKRKCLHRNWMNSVTRLSKLEL
jgi:hypothetical protein